MNKKVMAVAVAGALALPAAAMAQVTISGGFRMGLSNHSISNVNTAAAPAARFGGAAGIQSNTSEWRFGDNVTQIIFQAREDLGGGLTAVGRYEWRPIIDGNGNQNGQLASGTGNGTNFLGIESRTMGTFRLGSVATYSGAGGTGGPFTSDRALAFTGNVGMTQVIGTGVVVAPGQAMGVQQMNFGQGRQANSLTWNSPNWNGFTLTGVWSTQNSGNEGDLAANLATQSSAARKGNAIILAPGFRSGPFSMQYIWFDNKIDGTTNVGVGAWAGAATASGANALAVRDVKANKLWATYAFSNGFSLTGQWSKVTLTNAYTGVNAQTNFSGGSKLADQTKWHVGGRYVTGANAFTLDYTKVAADKVVTNAAGQTGGTGGKMWAASWMHELSKRTELGLSYAKLTNDSNNAYGPQDTASNGLGGANVASTAGESYTIWGANITHKF